MVRVLFPDDKQLVRSVRDRELRPLDSGEGFEGRSGRGAAPRAVTVRRVQKCVRDLVANSTALTSSCKATVGRVAFSRQSRLLSSGNDYSRPPFSSVAWFQPRFPLCRLPRVPCRGRIHELQGEGLLPPATGNGERGEHAGEENGHADGECDRVAVLRGFAAREQVRAENA